MESVVSSTHDLFLGDDAQYGTKWNGAFDEVRISNVVRSADWAKAEYDNQKSSQTLVTYGSVTGPRIVTSPLTASATVGTSFSYNITASTPVEPLPATQPSIFLLDFPSPLPRVQSLVPPPSPVPSPFHWSLAMEMMMVILQI